MQTNNCISLDKLGNLSLIAAVIQMCLIYVFNILLYNYKLDDWEILFETHRTKTSAMICYLRTTNTKATTLFIFSLIKE